MKPVKKILVVVDPTVERDFVVDRAILIARTCGAELVFYINNANTLTEHSFIYEGVDGEFFENQSKLFKKHYQQILKQLVDEAGKAKLTASSQFTEKHHLAEAIIEETEATNPDLVLKSTHHHSPLERSLISNTDWRLIRKCEKPLLLVKNTDWHDEGSIVTAVDPLHSKDEQSRLDHVLLRGALQLSEDLKLEMRVFHSYSPFVSTLFPMGGESQEHIDRIREFHLFKIRELLADYPIDEQHIHLSEGELVPALVEFTGEANANILVIGALSRNVLERAIVGNTAEKILEDCPCDILVLKS